MADVDPRADQEARGAAGVEEGVRMTAAQWREYFLALPPEEQENVAENVLRFSQESHTCFIQHHVGQIRNLEAQVQRMVAHHGPCSCDTGPGTDGPDEFCPQHGRPYSDLLGYLDELHKQVAAGRPT